MQVTGSSRLLEPHKLRRSPSTISREIRRNSDTETGLYHGPGRAGVGPAHPGQRGDLSVLDMSAAGQGGLGDAGQVGARWLSSAVINSRRKASFSTPRSAARCLFAVVTA